jgi:hypothetical protein
VASDKPVLIIRTLQVHDLIAQYPKKSREQISRENGGITWAQLEDYAKTPLAGLPERKGHKAPVKPKASKAKPTTKKVKGAQRRRRRARCEGVLV